MEVHEATEMYMKTILVLKKRLGTVRSIDVANEMGYSKPTISIAMKKFRQEGLITVDESNCIHLTEAGQTRVIGQNVLVKIYIMLVLRAEYGAY